jgi:hypothetical protein
MAPDPRRFIAAVQPATAARQDSGDRRWSARVVTISLAMRLATTSRLQAAGRAFTGIPIAIRPTRLSRWRFHRSIERWTAASSTSLTVAWARRRNGDATTGATGIAIVCTRYPGPGAPPSGATFVRRDRPCAAWRRPSRARSSRSPMLGASDSGTAIPRAWAGSTSGIGSATPA